MIIIGKTHKDNFFFLLIWSSFYHSREFGINFLSYREIQFTWSYMSTSKQLACDPNDCSKADMIFNNKVFSNHIDLQKFYLEKKFASVLKWVLQDFLCSERRILFVNAFELINLSLWDDLEAVTGLT